MVRKIKKENKKNGAEKTLERKISTI